MTTSNGNALTQLACCDERIVEYISITDQLKQGSYDVCVPTVPADEVGRLGLSLQELAQTLEGLEVVIRAKMGAHDRLYGAVTSTDIADEVQRLTGQGIDKRKIELNEPIHQLGEYEVPVKLSGDLAPKLKVVVEEELVEAKMKDSEKAKEEAQGEIEAKD